MEKEGIRCNLTLVFSMVQAVACAQKGITLISPFVGRINDSYAKKLNKSYAPHEEPGVLLVKDIYNFFKKNKYSTVVMAASLRTPESVLELAGCDRITMPPTILEKLASIDTQVEKKICADNASSVNFSNRQIDEKSFRWLLNEEEVGTEKLADGIRIFSRDAAKLEKIIREKIVQFSK